MNGLLNGHYFTIHVTPEEHCSYASFETSVPISGAIDGGCYDAFEEVVDKLIDIFKPGAFNTSLFVQSDTIKNNKENIDSLFWRGQDQNISGYRTQNRIVHSLGDWEVLFMHFEAYSHRSKKKEVQ